MIKKFVKNLFFSSQKEWKITESSGCKTDRRWSHCGFTQTWQRQRWEWTSLTGNRGENVRIQVSMRQCGLQAWGGKGTLGENNLAVELLPWICGAEIDRAGWKSWWWRQKLKKQLQIKFETLGGICRYRENDVSAGLQRNKGQCKRRNSVKFMERHGEGETQSAWERGKSRKGGLDALLEIPSVEG